jgi:hypothetical protein
VGRCQKIGAANFEKKPNLLARKIGVANYGKGHLLARLDHVTTAAAQVRVGHRLACLGT